MASFQSILPIKGGEGGEKEGECQTILPCKPGEWEKVLLGTDVIWQSPTRSGPRQLVEEVGLPLGQGPPVGSFVRIKLF